MMARWTRRVGLFTLALVFVGMVTAGIFWRQLTVMQHQLDEMERVYGPIKDQADYTKQLAKIANEQRKILDKTDQTARLRDRAFLYFGDPNLTQWPLPPKPTEVMAVAITYTNAGNMPGRRVVVQYDCSWPLNNVIPNDPFVVAKWHKLETTSVVGPKQGFVLQGCEIPISEFEDAINNKRSIFIMMKVTYIDGFDLEKERKTEMSRVLRFGKQREMSVGFAGPHNCSDDDCPK